MAEDKVAHPAHYNRGKIEVIEFIEDQQLGFHLGNVVKYIARAGHKDPARRVEDLEKASWYLARYVEIQKPNHCRPNEMPSLKDEMEREIARLRKGIAQICDPNMHPEGPAFGAIKIAQELLG